MSGSREPVSKQYPSGCRTVNKGPGILAVGSSMKLQGPELAQHGLPKVQLISMPGCLGIYRTNHMSLNTPGRVGCTWVSVRQRLFQHFPTKLVLSIGCGLRHIISPSTSIVCLHLATATGLGLMSLSCFCLDRV